MAVYPRAPPDGPMSTVNVLPLCAVIWLVAKGAHGGGLGLELGLGEGLGLGIGQLGTAVHPLTGSRVRLSGSVVTEWEYCTSK